MLPFQNETKMAVEELSKECVSADSYEELKAIGKKICYYEEWFGDIVRETFKNRVEEILILSPETLRIPLDEKLTLLEKMSRTCGIFYF